MKQYYAKVVTGRNQEQLEDNLNYVLAEAVKQGWQLHSQSSWFRNLGGVIEQWYKCTLIFEKEVKK